MDKLSKKASFSERKVRRTSSRCGLVSEFKVLLQQEWALFIPFDGQSFDSLSCIHGLFFCVSVSGSARSVFLWASLRLHLDASLTASPT